MPRALRSADDRARPACGGPGARAAWSAFRLAARDTWPRAEAARRTLLALLAVSAIGACDEKFQAGIPGRDSSVYDWLADTVGASLVTTVFAARARGARPAGA